MRKSALQRVLQKVSGRPVEEALRDLYVTRRHTDQEIADAWGIPRGTVQRWRSEFGIRREDRDAPPPLAAA